MPELPEVETIRRTLKPHLTGRKILDVLLTYPKLVHHPDPANFRRLLTGQTFSGVERRGKYLLLPLDGGWTLVIHLRMTGRLTVAPADAEVPLHTHVRIPLDDGMELRFQDTRKFGTMDLVPGEDWSLVGGLANLGPEPLSEDFNPEDLIRRMAGRKTKIKAFLLDQTMVAGIGNIYADEALCRARLHPEREVGSLSNREVKRLTQAVKEVLSLGIENRGTTFSDYLDGDGRMGENQKLLQAYGREGESCLHCGRAIRRIRVAGRSTFFCAKCQPQQRVKKSDQE